MIEEFRNLGIEGLVDFGFGISDLLNRPSSIVHRPRESGVHGVRIKIFSRTADEYEDEDDFNETDIQNSKRAPSTLKR
jgi:hypothetical protein